MAARRKVQPTPEHWGSGKPDPEKLDTTPVEMPLGAGLPMSLQDLIANSVRIAVEQEQNEEQETWDEANDFEEEDPDVLDFSPYELTDMEPEGDPTAQLEPEPPEAPQEERHPPESNQEGAPSGDGSPDEA